MISKPNFSTLAFSPIGSLKYGTSIRANYLINGLKKQGFQISTYEMGIASKNTLKDNKRMRSAISLPLLPGRFKKADIIFFEGIPFAPSKKRSDMMLSYLEKAKSSGKKVVLDLYDDPAFQRRDILGENVEPGVWQDVRNIFLKDADIVLFPSATMMGYYVQNKLIDEKKGHVLMNASDPEHFKSTKPPEKCIIGFLTGAGPGRGIEMLLEAFVQARKKIPDAELRIGCRVSGIQETDYLDNIRNNSESQGVHFNTDVIYPNAPDFLDKCSICVIPHKKSFYADLATPIKLFDYMAAGRPVVSTDCKETAQIINGEKTGIITDFTPESFSSGIINLWKNERLQAGENGREAVVKRHSWDIRAKELADIINSLMQ